MTRKGVSQGIELLIGVALALLVVAIAVFIIGMGPRAWRETFTCPVPDDTQFACVSVSKGCDSITGGEEWDRALTKFFGCNKGEICCVQNDKGSTKAPTTQSACEAKCDADNKGKPGDIATCKEKCPKDLVWPPKLTIDAVTYPNTLKDGKGELTGRTPVATSTIETIANRPLIVVYEMGLEGCAVVDDTHACFVPSLEFSVKDESGQEVRMHVARLLDVDEYTKYLKLVPGKEDKRVYVPGPAGIVNGAYLIDAPSSGLDPVVASLRYLHMTNGEISEAYPESATVGSPRARAFLFTFPDGFVGQTATVTIRSSLAYVEGPDAKDPALADSKNIHEISGSHTLRIKVKPAIRYGPLTQKWERSKEIFSICEDPIECSNMYFRVVANPSECSQLPIYAGASEAEATKGQSLLKMSSTDTAYLPQLARDRRVYCIRDENGAQDSCYSEQNKCIEALGVGASGEYGAALEALLQEIKKHVDVPTELSVFWKQEDKVSRRSCLPDLPDKAETQILGDRPDLLEGGPVGLGLLFRADQPDLTKDRWAFTLDMPYMQNQYLCVYGQSKTDPAKFYSAGEGQQIKIDRIPPTAQIQFNLLSLRITFLCEDTGGSQCADSPLRIGYISKGGTFATYFKNLVTRKSQNAHELCSPDLVHYRDQLEPQMRYSEQLVQVMCLEVRDSAGNTGYAVRMVFHTWQAVITLITELLDLESDPDYVNPSPGTSR